MPAVSCVLKAGIILYDMPYMFGIGICMEAY